MDEPLYKEKEKLKEQQDGYIKVNKEEPTLILAPKKEDNHFPDPEKEKEEFQKKKLSTDLKKKKRVKLNKNLKEKVHHPEIYKPEVPRQEEKDYQEEKKENLKKVSVIQNKISRVNIETDKKIVREAKTDNERMKLILAKLEEAAKEKKAYMLSVNSDPSEADYISHCVELDKLMKLHAACMKEMKDPKAREKALAQIKTLMENAQKRLQKAIAEKSKQQAEAKENTELKKEGEEEKQQKLEKKEKEEQKQEKKKEQEQKKADKKKSEKEGKKESLYKVVINDRKKKPEKIEKLKRKAPVTEKAKQTEQKVKQTEQKVKQTGQRNRIRENNQQIVPDGVQIIPFDQHIGTAHNHYEFIKREPKNLNEALDLRSQITKNFDVEAGRCPDVPFELYLYYDNYVEQFSQNEQIQFPPEYLEQIDVSGYPLEVVAALRNRIMARGLLYKDLKGAAKEAYDYYDRIVKHLIRTDGTMKENVEQHEKRQMPNHRKQLETNLNTQYEKQADASNDCWSCAGSAILNHFLRNTPNYKKVTQADFRRYRPVLKTKEEMGIDDDTYATQKNEIETFTIKNQKTDRRGTPMGNPYMLADFYLKELEKAGKKNTAVRKMVFQPNLATKQKNGLRDNTGKLMGKDTNALHNLRAKFKDVVKKALDGGSAISLLYGVHYLTIVGINGNTLTVHNSASKTPGVTQTRSIDDVLRDSTTQNAVELIWFQSITDPAELTRQFKNLSYDPNTKQYRENVKNFSENIGQKDGVGAWKTLDEKDNDVADLVMEGIYLPKQLA